MSTAFIEWIIFVIGFFMPLILMIAEIVLDWINDIRSLNKKHDSIMEDLDSENRDFQKELEDVLKEAETMHEELPLVTLWWGLQGLRLNKDGTTEWISRRPVDIPKDDPITASPSFGYAIGPQIVPTYPLACTRLYQPILYGFDCRNATPEDRISFLEAQERELTLAMAQSYQTRAILDNLKQWEVVNDEKQSYVKITDAFGNSYLESCIWTDSQ